VAQIEQVWCEALELSGCECVACSVPMTHTRATQSMHTTLTKTPRFADLPNMPSQSISERYCNFTRKTILPLDDHLWNHGEGKMQPAKYSPEHGL
jgi:hypothetical protein